ncbi:MAG: rhodanese-like domain-containing protein [Patescibacteria group bacterium]|nr:rhodanese-like domain-containing protein [Patescibacteria group bacterium]
MDEKRISQKAKFFLSIVGASSLIVPVFLWYLYNNVIFPSPKLAVQTAPSTSSSTLANRDNNSPNNQSFDNPLPLTSENGSSTSAYSLSTSSAQVSNNSSSSSASTSGQVAGVQSKSFQEITATTLYTTLMKESPLILDVRSAQDFGSGHLPGSSNLPPEYLSYLDQYLSQNGANLPKDKSMVVYSNSGSDASKQLAEKLITNGFQNVYVLIDGYQAWIKAGYPVEK